MAAIITSKFRFHNAEQFKESFSEAAATNYYLFIGRPSEFASGTTGGTDALPPTPVDNRRSEAYLWDDMLAAKKIDSTGVTHAIPRRDLDISGSTTYDMYRPNYSATTTATSGATNLFDSTFYFVTSAYRVYKVLDNGVNGTVGAWSSSEGTPTSTAAGPFTTGNYMIKYMFTLTTAQVQNFLTPDFVASPTAPESARADGKLDVVKITTAGAMTPVPSGADLVVYNVPIRGDGTGGLASITIGGSSGSADGTVTVASVTTTADVNYTHATITAADIKEQYDIQQATTLSWTTNPVFEVIIGPDGGHGSNPAKELGGHFAMMDVKLQQTETYDFSVVNDFRQVGVLRNPNSYGTSSAYTSTSARQTYAIKLASGSNYVVDEKISQTFVTPTVKPQTGSAPYGITVSGSVLTVTTTAAHQFADGQLVTIDGGTFSGGATTGHKGTHYIDVTSTTAFTYTVGTQRTPTGTMSGTATCVPKVPQGVVVEYDAGNNVLFYIQNPYTDQGTSSTGEKIPFSGNAPITGTSATGVPDITYSSTLNNTAFTSGYANPEMSPDSGDIIYIENRKPISRASDQTEDIKLIVEF